MLDSTRSCGKSRRKQIVLCYVGIGRTYRRFSHGPIQTLRCKMRETIGDPTCERPRDLQCRAASISRLPLTQSVIFSNGTTARSMAVSPSRSVESSFSAKCRSPAFLPRSRSLPSATGSAPISGTLAGYVSDVQNRRVALVVSITGMAVPTFLAGVLPGYWASRRRSALRSLTAATIYGSESRTTLPPRTRRAETRCRTAIWRATGGKVPEGRRCTISGLPSRRSRCCA